jgi:putative copper resistance protein D
MLQIIIEWVQLVCLTFCIGVIVSRLWFFSPSMQAEFSHDGKFSARLWKLFCFGLAFLIAGSIAGLVFRSMEMSGRPLSEISSVLPLVLFKTHYGTVWFIRIAALLLLAVAKTVTRYRDTRPFLFYMLMLALVVSMTSSASGHGADAGDFSIPEIMDWIHLIAACLWGGGLIVLSLSILPDLIGGGKGSPPLISHIADRFSAMAGVAVALIVITAVYNFLIDVRTVSAMVKTPYGLAVAAKILLLLALVALGSFNRYVSVPQLREWAGGSSNARGVVASIAARLFARFRRNRSGPAIALRFKRLVGLETVLILAVFFCAALLRHETPARHYMHMQHQTESPMQHNMGMDMDHSPDHHAP